MNLSQAKFRPQAEPPIEPATVPYPFETILGDVRNRSHRRLDWSNWILTAFLLLAIIAAVCEAF